MAWLSRDLMTGPFVALVTNEKEYRSALKHLGVASPEKWLQPGFPARTHYLHSLKGDSACIVAIDKVAAKKATMFEVYGLLVHEAVHVWQEHCRHIGEDAPGHEQEAYAIQVIAQRLMAAYVGRR